ncbi:hypothetical protein RJT34_06399 [Clitoria ternatea]|uniref:Galactose oxidase n=1 Tax=Clitoria ternatea TaxID=43366 RepID=A0AAN9K2H2_CLITE
MAFKIKNAPSFLFLFLIFHATLTTTTSSSSGHWVQLQRSIGISAMHMQVMIDNKVVIFDRTDFGPSNISLANNRCRFNPHDMTLKLDCTAHSVLYDPSSNTLRPLTLQSDAWCSSGSLSPDGTLIQTGGFNDGYNKLRTFTPCPNHNQCDWLESPRNLSNSRWYASNQLLPDGTIIIVGGRSSFTYEFVPKNEMSFHFLNFLRLTRDPNRGEENNLYPFLHLLPDGNLFIFANRNSILFDYKNNRVIRDFPVIPGLEKRNYPSTGSSVLLPLNLTGLNGTRLPDAEVMVCGGAFPGAFGLATKFKVFLEASKTCGRLRVTDAEPQWVMEKMPTPRVMPDMVLLPDGNVVILNGAMNGTAGWENAANPALCPVLYRPGSNQGFRFQSLAPANTPRMYHSAAVLLPDGRILVGGSNPHRLYDFRSIYPTELSLDAYYPDYLGPKWEPVRPTIVAVEETNDTASHGRMFSVTFSLRELRTVPGISVSLVAPSFTTHSFGMNQRVLVLDVVAVREVAQFGYKVVARGPPSLAVAPPGYYMLFIVHAGVPSTGVWVQVK